MGEAKKTYSFIGQNDEVLILTGGAIATVGDLIEAAQRNPEAVNKVALNAGVCGEVSESEGHSFGEAEVPLSC